MPISEEVHTRIEEKKQAAIKLKRKRETERVAVSKLEKSEPEIGSDHTPSTHLPRESNIVDKPEILDASSLSCQVSIGVVDNELCGRPVDVVRSCVYFMWCSSSWLFHLRILVEYV